MAVSVVDIQVNATGATQQLRAVQQGSQAADKSVSGLLSTVGKLAIVLGAIEAVQFVFAQTAELESQTRSLEVLTGSAIKTKQIIQELQQLGAVTPFTSSELIDAAKRLQAFGVEGDKVVETTRRLADVSGATGAELQGLVTAYGQVQAKGRLQGEELLQFQERGIGLQGELQKMYGLSGQELQKALAKGRISAEAVEVAIIRLTNAGGKYANGAIAQSDTLNGKFSTLMDNIEMLAKKIGQVLEPAIKGILNTVTGIVDKLSKFLDDPELKAYLDVATKIMSQSDKAAVGNGKKTANNELFNTRAEIKKLTTEIKAAEKAGIGMSKGLEIKGIDNNVIIPSAPVLPIMKAELAKLNKEAIELENRLKEFKKPKATKEDVNLKTPALLEEQTKKLALEKQLSDARIQYERQIADFRESTLRRIVDMERTLQDQRIKANFDLQQSQLKLAGSNQFIKQTQDISRAIVSGKSPADIQSLETARDSAKTLNDAAINRRQIEFDSTMKRIQLERTLTDFKKGIERETGEMQKGYARQTGDILTKAGTNIQSAMIKGAQEVAAIMMRITTGRTPPPDPVLPQPTNQQANSATAGVGRIITPEMTRPRPLDAATRAGMQGPPGSQSMQVDAVNNIRQFSSPTAKLDNDTNELKREAAEQKITDLRIAQSENTKSLAESTKTVLNQSEANLNTSKEKNKVDQKTLDLIVSGTNPALAAQFAQNEQLNAQSTAALENQKDKVLASLDEKNITFQQHELRLEDFNLLSQQIAKQPQVLEGLNQQAIKQKQITDATQATVKAADDLKALYSDIGMSIKSSVIEGIQGAIDGTKRLQDVATDLLKKIADKLLDVAVNMALFGSMSGTGTGGGLLGGLFKRAKGGSVTGGSPYLVGERGPELFMPGRSGGIAPAGSFGGGTNVVVNVDATGSNVQGDDQSSKQLGVLLAAAVQKELIKQKRPGGILA